MGPEARPVGICQVLSVSNIWAISDSILLEREKRVARERDSTRDRKTDREIDRHTETEALRDTERAREEQSKTRTGS